MIELPIEDFPLLRVWLLIYVPQLILMLVKIIFYLYCCGNTGKLRLDLEADAGLQVSWKVFFNKSKTQQVI